MSEVLDHIMSRVATPRPDCLIWPDAVDRGYGRIWVNGRAARVHRVVWEEVNGPIPDGLTVDHLCRIRYCCNPAHMELVTPAENAGRVASRPRKEPLAPGGRCGRGHLITSEADLAYWAGRRSGQCRACRKERRGLAKAGEGLAKP